MVSTATPLSAEPPEPRYTVWRLSLHDGGYCSLWTNIPMTRGEFAAHLLGALYGRLVADFHPLGPPSPTRGTQYEN